MTYCEKCIHYDICKIDANLIPDDFVNFFPHNTDCGQFKDKAEIQSLQDRIDTLNDTNKRLMESQEVYWKSKLEDFVDRLKEEGFPYEECNGEGIVYVADIDKLKREMVSER